MPQQYLYQVTIEYDEDGDIEAVTYEVYAFSEAEAKQKAKSRWAKAGKLGLKILGIAVSIIAAVHGSGA